MRGRRLSIKEQALFAKRLAFLVKAGVPLLESLKMMRLQTQSASKMFLLDRLITDVSSGQLLAASLERFRNRFGDFAVNLIRVGESSGILDQNLNYLADELKKKQALRRKVVGALVYPIFITVATLSLTILLTVYIFPKVLPIFKSLNVGLPFSTRALIFASAFLRAEGIWLLLGLLVLGLAAWILWKRAPRFRFLADRLTLRIPLAGRIVRSYNMTNFCRTLGLLLKSGVHIVEAVSITADATPNSVYKRELHVIAKNVSKGERISKYLDRYPHLFPDVLGQMVSIGERTGTLSETLLYLSELHEGEVDDFTKSMSGSLEPILMIFMGLIVGFVAVSVIAPIYEITQNIHP